MTKSSKKRRLPKLPKWRKFLKLKKSSKEKEIPEEVANQNGGRSTPPCVPEYTKLQAEVHEEDERNDLSDLKQSLDDVSKELKATSCTIESAEKSKNSEEKLMNGQVNNDTRAEQSKHENIHNEKIDDHLSADIVVHSILETPNSEKIPELQEQDNDSKVRTHDENINSILYEKGSASTSKRNLSHEMDEYPEELIYPVVIKTPYVKQKSETAIKVNEELEQKSEHRNGYVQHIQCKVVVHTPVKKQLMSNPTLSQSVFKTDDGDSALMPMPQTPLPKKPEKRDSQRMLTVKKIRSIIATPYKKIKRDSSSLLDGQTYRYIEIQSLVNAFQTLHPCKGAMIATNEKGLQYGKSSVLRIKCEDCHVEVFLQAAN